MTMFGVDAVRVVTTMRVRILGLEDTIGFCNPSNMVGEEVALSKGAVW